MRRERELSRVTKRYLARYREIFEEMKRAMTAAPNEESIAQDFIVQMIPHHRAAIEMSENLLRFTTWLPLERVAENIVTAQTEGIAEMERALAQCRLPASTPAQAEQYGARLAEIENTMFREMGNAPEDNSINVDFIREMIPHHRGAIRMAENALRFPLCEELKPILQNIIRTQTEGIRTMQRLYPHAVC